MDMPTVDQVKSKVQRLLTSEFGSVRVDKDGDFVITYNSAAVFIRVGEGLGKADTVVSLLCPLVREMRLTPDLYKWVALEGGHFKLGYVSLTETGGKGTTFFEYSLVGDDLDPSELLTAVVAVVLTGDRLDNELRDRFGGELFGRE